MDALPTSGVWRSYERMLEESVYVVKDFGKCCWLCLK